MEPPLGESETFRTFTNRHQQLLAQFFLAGILRQIQLIEAGMCRGQDVFAPVRTMNVEATNTIRPVERFESIERNLQTRHEQRGRMSERRLRRLHEAIFEEKNKQQTK